MLTEFPVIHTNVWDAFWAVPVILLIIYLIKALIKLPSNWVSTVASISGLIIAVFISHRGNLSAGIFMGFFYGGAAIGFIYSIEKSFEAYRKN